MLVTDAAESFLWRTFPMHVRHTFTETATVSVDRITPYLLCVQRFRPGKFRSLDPSN